MRLWFGILMVAAAGFTLAGCNKPKKDCEGSYKSYQHALDGHDWDAMYELLTPEFQKKTRSADRFGRVMEQNWQGAKSFRFTTDNVAETKSGVCTVQGDMKWTTKIRGASAYDTEEYFSWTFRQGKDGLWRIELPGSEKISAF